LWPTYANFGKFKNKNCGNKKSPQKIERIDAFWDCPKVIGILLRECPRLDFTLRTYSICIVSNPKSPVKDTKLK